VFWSFAYLALRRILQLLVLVLRGDRSKEIEISYSATRSESFAAKYGDQTAHRQIVWCSPRCHGWCAAAPGPPSS
jgi:hypothetical protein